MPTTCQYAAATAVLAGELASAFIAPAPAPAGLQRARAARQAAPRPSMELDHGKPGTGKNRMTDTGFAEPLVERKEFPGTLHGYQWVVKDVVAEKKLNAPEKLKKAKPGLQIGCAPAANAKADMVRRAVMAARDQKRAPWWL